MITYKGMNKDMTCKDGFQYEPGKPYQMDGPVEVCKRGFHACERPLDVFDYYPPASSRYFEVEQSGKISKGNDDSKIASSEIKIGAEIGIPGLVKAHIEYVKAHTTQEHTDPKQATAGFRGAATAGSSGAATAGDSGAATAGSYGAATAGFRGAATAGFRGAATAGDSGAATAGDRGAATAGDRGAATSRGSSAVGENGIACARGNGCRVKGGLGSVLVIAEEKQTSYALENWKAVVVDGEQIKADTWYMLVNGELQEVAE